MGKLETKLVSFSVLEKKRKPCINNITTFVVYTSGTGRHRRVRGLSVGADAVREEGVLPRVPHPDGGAARHDFKQRPRYRLLARRRHRRQRDYRDL